MDTQTQYRSSNANLNPVKSLRITVWGAQGSCPVFPQPKEVTEYTRRIACYALGRALEDMLAKTKDGKYSVEDLLGGPFTPAAVEQYQKRLGLPDVPVYGGETTCTEVEASDGNIFIFDGGSGIRHCALSIVNRWANRKDRKIHVFGTHEHLDHRSGIPFARFCFVKDIPFDIHILGSHGFLMALDGRFGFFSKVVTPRAHLDDPLDHSFMSARFSATEFTRPPGMPPAFHEGSRPWEMHDISHPVKIGETTITPFDVYHGDNRCLAYKIQSNGKTFVFSTDHELRHGDKPDDPRQQKSEAAEARLLEHLKDADLAYMDGQYFLDEYKGKKGVGSSLPAPRKDWGHSCIEDCIARAQKCRIKHTLIGHYDPEREWPEKIEIDHKLTELCKGTNQIIELAKGSALFEL